MRSESSLLFGFTDSRGEDAMAGMLWCEQWWTLLPVLTDSWCISASGRDKVASVCHMVACIMPSHLTIIPAFWKRALDQFPNMKRRRHKCSVACSCSFTCYSGQAIGSLYQECHTSKLCYHCHSAQTAWEWKVGKKVLSRRTPANNAGEITVWTTNAVVFSIPASHNYIFLFVNPTSLMPE